MGDEDEAIEVVQQRAMNVRLTRTLYRLTPIAEIGPGLFGRHIATIAADTEDEARYLASLHDPFRRDWKNRGFASADAQHSDDDHLFGDVTFRSEPPPAELPKP